MVKKVRLNKRWKEILFAAAGFGPNLLMVLMTAYFSDALIPTGINASANFYTYGGTIIVSTLIFPILWFLGRLFDGIIDVPLGAWTDNIQKKTGKRFIGITIAFLPMILSYIACWFPIFGRSGVLTTGQQIGNTIWIFFWSIVFFASYTLGLITFYGSLADVCENQTQRARVSAYKSVFDTVTYALGYAAIPAIFGESALNLPIWQAAIYMSPLMLTILIPLLMGKKEEGKEQFSSEKQIPIGRSIALTVKSRPFMKWIIVYCFSFFGLQLFLAAQNTLISSVINIRSLGGALSQTILNTAAFAPVPLFILLFNKVRKNKGIRFAYQTALLAFAFGILILGLSGDYIWHNNDMMKLILGIIAGVIASWGIGAFFMVPYLIPTTIASVEEEVTGKNHSAMYFAVQALFSSAAGALSSALLYDFLKQWAENPGALSHPENYSNAQELMEAVGMRYGVSIVPGIVFIMSIAGFFLAFIMPKKYTPKVIYDDLKKSAEKRQIGLLNEKATVNKKISLRLEMIDKATMSDAEKATMSEHIKNSYSAKLTKIDKALDECKQILELKFDEEHSVGNEEKDKIEKSSILATILLFILTGGISNIFAIFFDLNKFKHLDKKAKAWQIVLIVLGLFIPFLSIYTSLYFSKRIEEYSKENNLNIKSHKWICLITSILLPCFSNIVELIIRTNCLNKISKSLD